MSTIGPIATLVDGLFRFFTSEDGYAEFQRRRELSAARDKAMDALKKRDWPALRERVAELERLSNRP